MAYCTSTDVAAVNPKRSYTATSTPTSTQVQTHIDLIAAELDTILATHGLTTPAVAPSELMGALRVANAYGAASTIEQAMFPETILMGSTPHWKSLEDKYQYWKKKLEDGDFMSFTSDDRLVGSLFTTSDAPVDPETGDVQGPKFSMNQEF